MGHTLTHTEDWQGFGGIQGGLLLAQMMNAAAAAPDPDEPGIPLAISAHFLEPVPPGPVTVDTTVLRGGRTASVAANIGSALHGLVRVGSARGGVDSAFGADTYANSLAPDGIPDPESLPRVPASASLVTFSRHLDIRAIRTDPPFRGGDDPSFDAWVRVVDEGIDGWKFSPADIALILLDSMPPGIAMIRTTPAMVPTAEYTVHLTPAALRPRDPLGFNRVLHRSVWATDTLCLDEAEVYDRAGALLGQARQVRRIKELG